MALSFPKTRIQRVPTLAPVAELEILRFESRDAMVDSECCLP